MRHYWSRILIYTLSIALMAVSCKKSSFEENSNPEETLTVPSSFTWETTRAVNINIQSGDANANGLLYKVSIYTSNPTSSSTPINSGAVGYGYPFKLTQNLPVTTKTLYLKISYPTGGETTVSQDISGNTFSYVIPSTVKAKTQKTVVISGPDCNTGCESTISGSATATITGGKTYCITGTFNGALNFEFWSGGGTLRICGNATITSATLGSNCNIVVAEGGTLNVQSLSMDANSQIVAWPNTTVKFESLNMNSSSSSLTNYSNNMSFSGEFAPNGSFTNYGKITIAQGLNTGNNDGSIENTGTIRVLGSIDFNQNLYNSGTIESDGQININVKREYVNECKIISHDDIKFNNGTFTCNSGYVQASGSIDVNGSCVLTLQNQSMLKANDITFNTSITGSGSKNSIISTGSGTINGNSKIKGAIEWADVSGTLKNGSQSDFTNGATFVKLENATNVIPISDCNPVGIGVPKDIDKDGDGVADILDDYPTDPDRAFDSYFPSKSGFATFAFEDLWPSTGDYDFNDLVVNAQVKYVTNARNLVVDIVGKYYVAAVGGSYKSGFGLQLDKLLPGDIKSVTRSNSNSQGYITENSNGTENGPDKAVVILWDNTENMIHRAGGSTFNAITGNPVGKSDTLNIKITLAAPKAVEEVGSMPLNHFLIKNMERKVEIHLPNAKPTSLANTGLFGTANDASKPDQGRYYVTAGNLPWALYLPSQFDYPTEKTSILDAYLKFESWAESGGTLYPDWYSNSQYRNENGIYKK